MDRSLIKAREAYTIDNLDEALTILNELTDPNVGEALFLKGEIYYKQQKWGESLNHFSLFLEQHPSDRKAETYCVMIQNILSFYHKDLYNP